MSKETDSCIYCGADMSDYRGEEFCDDCFQDMVEFDR